MGCGAHRNFERPYRGEVRSKYVNHTGGICGFLCTFYSNSHAVMAALVAAIHFPETE